MSALDVSLDMKFALTVVASINVKLVSVAVNFVLVPPIATFCPATGVIVIPPDVEDRTLPSNLKLSTFN